MYLVRRNSYSLASASERCHRERRRAIRGADGDVRPLPLGRGSTWRPADRCGQADQCAYVRPSEGRGVGRGGRRVRERAWVVTQLGGRWGGLGRCAPPRRGDADPRRNTMPTSSAAHVDARRLHADVGELPAWCFSSRLRRRTAGAAPLCHLTVDRQSALERLGNGPTPPRDLLHARWPV